MVGWRRNPQRHEKFPGLQLILPRSGAEVIHPHFASAVRTGNLTYRVVHNQRLEVGGGMYLRRTLTVRGVVQRNWRDGGRVMARTFVSGQVAYWF